MAQKEIIEYAADSDEDESKNNNLDDAVIAIFQNYSSNSLDLEKTRVYIDNYYQSGICLICLRSVKNVNKIWSCSNCFCFYHLLCIQKWANESINQKALANDSSAVGYYSNSGEFIPKKVLEVVWDCPQCRTFFLREEIPRHYECFCKKEHNPEHHPWLLPHSCGSQCSKPLIPKCGHKCTLLCHPGPCPICPQTLSISCRCGKSPLKTIRCSKKEWTCNNKCSIKLSCMSHICENICHPQSECPPCTKMSIKFCECGSTSKEIKCEQSNWKCQKVCNKSFSCNLHKCKKLCHKDDCGPCVLGLPRSCPCGKQKTVAPCTEVEVESCGDTCSKILDCGIHYCSKRCHKGSCGDCIEFVTKSCKCGAFIKEFACSKVFNCETKCKNMRLCKKHPCSKKCCNNECPPCDKICNKFLSCSKHKCKAFCHDGNCYPCNLKTLVKCRCGETTVTVYCGREKKIKSIKCKQPCKIPSKCHHTNPHRCHIGDCPNCVQMCNLYNTTTACKHLCEAKCHDFVKVITKNTNFKPAGPWDIPDDKVEFKKLPHPTCEVGIPIICIGGHDTSMLACHSAKALSCGRPCGRSLNCGNHKCMLECHNVSDVHNEDQDENCEDCIENCSIQRPLGCTHTCPRQNCHKPPCKKCIVPMKSKCFCGLIDIHYRCCDFYKRDIDFIALKELKDKKLSCGNRCIKNYPCGHRCNLVCHSGICNEKSNSCTKKVKVLCPCKTRKVEISCDKIQAENIEAVHCNEVCEAKKKNLELEHVERILQQKIETDELNKRELEEFEQKFTKKKKSKDRRNLKMPVKDEKNYKGLFIFTVFSVVIVILAVLAYFTIF